MITIFIDPPPASARWADLTEELDRWGAQGRKATLWWRDDDAVAPSHQLAGLVNLARGVPVALAVIPALIRPSLADWLENNAASSWRILQHGWRHVAHATDKKSEFPATRDAGSVAAELACGRQRLQRIFGDRALPVLAPPWNRFAEKFLAPLAEAGLAGITALKPRRAAYPYPGVAQANVHVDLIAWRGNRGFIGEGLALGGLVAHLAARRCGRVDCDEPTGILTHHLVQDEATGAFLARLTRLTLAHPAAAWLTPDAVFAPAAGGSGARGSQ